MRKELLVIMLACLLLYGCGKKNPAGPGPLTTNTAVSTSSISPTASCTPTVTLTFETWVPTSTLTDTPPATFTFTASPTKTITATAEDTSTGTPVLATATGQPTTAGTPSITPTFTITATDTPAIVATISISAYFHAWNDLTNVYCSVSIYDTSDYSSLMATSVKLYNLSHPKVLDIPYDAPNSWYYYINYSAVDDYIPGDLYRVEVVYDTTTYYAQITAPGNFSYGDFSVISGLAFFWQYGGNNVVLRLWDMTAGGAEISEPYPAWYMPPTTIASGFSMNASKFTPGSDYMTFISMSETDYGIFNGADAGSVFSAGAEEYRNFISIGVPTATPSQTGTPTETETILPTETDTLTITDTPTQEDTFTQTETFTPTVTDTPQDTPTGTDTPENTPTRTETEYMSPTITSTSTDTFTITETTTDSPTFSVTETSTVTETLTMTVTLTPTLTMTPTSTNTPLPDWFTIGTGISPASGFRSCLAVSAAGLFEGYMAGTNPNNYIGFRKYNGTGWDAQGPATLQAWEAGKRWFTVDAAGTLYYAFCDSSNNVIAYKNSAQLGGTIATFSYQPVVYYEPVEDRLYVAYIDGNVGYKVNVKYFNGTSWVQYGNASFTPRVYQAVNTGSIAMDGYYNGGFANLFVGYAANDAAGNSRASVSYYNGASWGDFAGYASTGRVPNLDIRALGSPSYNVYLSFTDAGNAFKTTIKRSTGGSWSLVGTGTVSSGSSTDNSIYAVSATEIYSAYSDGTLASRQTVSKYNGSAWSVLGTAGFSIGSASHDSVVVSGGIPYCGFIDAGNSYKASVYKYQ